MKYYVCVIGLAWFDCRIGQSGIGFIHQNVLNSCHGVRRTLTWFGTTPMGVRRQAICCVSLMHESSSSLNIFWALSLQLRPHPSLFIKPFSNTKKKIAIDSLFPTFKFNITEEMWVFCLGTPDHKTLPYTRNTTLNATLSKSSSITGVTLWILNPI